MSDPVYRKGRSLHLTEDAIAEIKDDGFVQGSLYRFAHAAAHPEKFHDRSGYITDIIVSIFKTLEKQGAIIDPTERGLDMEDAR